MTKEEKQKAIKSLQFVRNALDDSMDITTDYDIAIKALKQEPCYDAINRQAGTEECHECMWESKYEQDPCTGWHIAHGMYEDRFWCSCGYIKVVDSSMSEWKYCPICGAKESEE